MEQQYQFLAQMTDYNDIADEIEIEAEANAIKIKNQLLFTEQDKISDIHIQEMKKLEQDTAIQRSSYISTARRSLMNETKAIFDTLQNVAAERIQQFIQNNKSKYEEFLDKLILSGAGQFEEKIILSLNPSDKAYVEGKVGDYEQQANIKIEIGEDLDTAEYGVKIYNSNQKICINSTVSQRLKQAMKVKAPELNAIVLPDIPLIE